MTETEGIEAILKAMRQTVRAISDLPYEDRQIVLMGVMGQEICTLPPSERAGEVNRLRGRLAAIYKASEAGMRQGLINNIKGGGDA